MSFKKPIWIRAVAWIACWLLPFALMAQERTITGRIFSKGDQTPISGASVLVKGTSNGTTTNTQGNFILRVANDNAVLVISYVGFNTQEVAVNGGANLSIQLTQENTTLTDVVVVGYGTQKKSTLTGSVTSVKGSEVNKSPNVNVSNSLVGRLPGLVAVNGSGEPGYDGSTIRVRGINTFGDASPLVVVDGVPGRSLERQKGKLHYRHVVSNAQELLQILQTHPYPISLAGHFHSRQVFSFESTGQKTRFEQAAGVTS